MDTDLTYFRFEPATGPDSAHFRRLKGFDSPNWLKREAPIGDAFPADATFVMSDDFPDSIVVEDAVKTIGSELVVSPRARAVIAPMVGDAVEWLEVGLVNHDGQRVPEPYAIAHALRHVDAIDREASAYKESRITPGRLTLVTHLVVDEGRIPNDATLFRLVGLPRVLGVRRDVAEAVREAGLTGFDFLPFTGFRG